MKNEIQNNAHFLEVVSEEKSCATKNSEAQIGERGANACADVVETQRFLWTPYENKSRT